ncbi:MAG: arginine--tRNA ligase, partial [Chloroflexi bacterium]|nr:arginine--tRNA ligase [Chloroflexota bacterium]
MIKKAIQKSLLAALENSQAAGQIPKFAPPEPVVEIPALPEHGDYASNLPLQIARQAKMPPLKLAQALVKAWPETEAVSKVEFAPPGFINFTLSDGWLARQVEAILDQGQNFGRLDIGRGQRIQVEYGSANPTGPLHIGFGRNVVIGDTLANVLAHAGYQVQREYYINDAGTQTEFFAESLYARYAQALGKDQTVPEKGYHGEYMVEWGQRLAEEQGDKYLKMPRDKALAEVGEMGLGWVLADVRQDLERMRIGYD